MGSFDLQKWTRIGAMNPDELTERRGQKEGKTSFLSAPFFLSVLRFMGRAGVREKALGAPTRPSYPPTSSSLAKI